MQLKWDGLCELSTMDEQLLNGICIVITLVHDVSVVQYRLTLLFSPRIRIGASDAHKGEHYLDTGRPHHYMWTFHECNTIRVQLMKLMLINLKAICSKTTESALYTHMQTLCNMCNLVVLRLGKIKIMLSIYSRRYHAGKSTHKPASPYSCYDTTLGHDTARL